ncbi:MAG: signal recognition particle-docking protein FtsY [Alphaproteobacteria bacterium]|nr:MAG: signal recognition particle-docking protein FtsY [Alphaproteobacteria bacterium]
MLRLFRKKQESRTSAETAPEAANDGTQETNWLKRLKQGLQKSADNLTAQIDNLVNKRKLDTQTISELEEILIAGDMGVSMSAQIVAELAQNKFDKEVDGAELRQELAAIIAGKLKPYSRVIEIDAAKSPFVILVIGVNGAGKTTTIGKLTHHLNRQGHKIMLAAADTFRAAATEQLDVWCKRTGSASFFYKPNVSDPAALAYEALQSAQGAFDVLIVDTAGRLHTRTNLMQELEKIPRVLKKIAADAPHETFLVLDATTGQNAIAQVENFHKSVPLTGLIVTKLDGTARGGAILAIAEKTKIPVVAIGVGEGIDDLQPFDPIAFANNLLGI